MATLQSAVLVVAFATGCAIAGEDDPTPPSAIGQTSYSGPGTALCLLNVDTTGDGAGDLQTCVIMCRDNTGTGTCDETTCNGTCPAGLACTETASDWSACL